MSATRSADLLPGTLLRYKQDGKVVVLDRRKREREHVSPTPFRPGWWLRGNALGLADSVIDAEDSDWSVLDA